MPTALEYIEEVKVLAEQLSQRVTEADKEQKARHEELTSKTTTIAAEHKTVTDRLNERINELVDKLEKDERERRLAELRPPLEGKAKKQRSEHHQAFMRALKKQGDLSLLTPEDRQLIMYSEMPAERKAMYAGDATTGGFFASTDFISELLEYKLLISPMRKVCRVQPTSGERVQMPALANDATAFWQAEQASYNNSQDPTVSMVNIPVHELRGLLKVSQQNLEDSMFNLEDLIKERLMLQFVKTEGQAFVAGNGVGKPRGLLSYPTQLTTTFAGGSAGKNNPTTVIPYVQSGAATGKINADDVLNVKMDLKADYDPQSTYIFTRGTLNSIRLLKDAMSRPLWQPFAGANLPSLIYDSPYLEMPDMPEIASGNFCMAVGDFKQYMIVDRLTMNMQQLNELYIASGLIGFIARMRTGGDVLVPEAFRLLKIN